MKFELCSIDYWDLVKTGCYRKATWRYSDHNIQVSVDQHFIMIPEDMILKLQGKVILHQEVNRKRFGQKHSMGSLHLCVCVCVCVVCVWGGGGEIRCAANILCTYYSTLVLQMFNWSK